MLPQSHLLQLVPGRVAAALKRLRGALYTDPVEITDIQATEPSATHVPYAKARRLPLKPVARPSHWGMLWDQRWFRLRLPKAEGSGDLYLIWQDQAEATLHLDGMPHFGFDPAHGHAPLPEGMSEVWIESVVCQTGIWIGGATGIDPTGSHLKGARLVRRNGPLWRLWHDLQAMDEMVRAELKVLLGDDMQRLYHAAHHPPLEKAPARLRTALRALDETLDALETRGVDAALRRMAAGYEALRSDPSSPKAILTGHAHIDLVWLWPERVGEFKAVHTFATANTLLKRHPDFRFGYSQPASYEAVGRLSPALHDEVRRRIRECRWDAVGATEVESDTLLACGEALARSFLIGQRRFRALRGSPSRLLWLPDVFGYTPCLPQIMRETGVDYFYTTKLSWCALTRFPHSSFVWRGHDGSEVLCHITQEHGYNQSASAEQLRDGELAHRQSDLHPEFLAPTGYGDGGGGVTEEMIERAKRFRDLAGVPPAEWGNLEPFFERLASVRDRLPVHQGELYLEYHRGTYTTHGDIKAGMRRAERALQLREAAHCATGAGPLPEREWRRVVFAQFHDYIPGSSIHEVYDEARAELAGIASRAAEAAVAALGSRTGGPCLFNPSPLTRIHVFNTAGGSLSAFEIAPLSGAPVADLRPLAAPEPVRAGPRRLRNGRVDARIDARGRVSSLTIDGRPLALRAPLCELVLHPDVPAMFEAWDIDRSALSLGAPATGAAEITLESATAASATLACRRSLGTAGTAIVRYTLEAGAPFLRVDIELDWRREQALLKLSLPTAYAGRNARYGAPFGSVLRSQVPGEVADEAKWEVPASRWAAVCDETEADGLFVVTESKFGFSCRDGELGVSLVRSARITGEGAASDAPSAHPPAIRRTKAASPFSDIGAHRISLAIGRHRADAPRAEQAASVADTLFQPLLPYAGGRVSCGLAGIEGGESLQPVWAKPAEEGDRAWVLRLNETLGRRGGALVRLSPGWRARTVDLSESPLPSSTWRSGNVRVPFTPYALLSLRIEPAS